MRDGNLRKIFHTKLRKVHFQSVESGMTGSGIPDSNFCYNGVEGWIEFKRARLNSIDIRPEQRGWMIDRARHGGIVRIAVRFDELAGQDLLLMFDGADAEHFRTRAITEMFPHGLDLWSGGPNGWPWDQVLATMTTRYK